MSTLSNGIREIIHNAQMVKSQYGGGIIYNLIDIIFCILCYGARPNDYTLFQFFKLRSRERNKFVTFYRHQKMYKLMREIAGDGKIDIVDNKENEYKVFNKFIHRDYIVVKPNDKDDLVISFLKEHGDIIAKPSDSTFGRGVVKLNFNDKNTIDTLQKERLGHTYIIEECLKNCKEFDLLNSSSLNTIRAFTHIDNNGIPEIKVMLLRVGTPGMLVDNWGAGGVVYNVDIETGIIDRPGVDKKNKPFLFHPGSGVKMIGYEIPKYTELKKYILEMASVLPKAKVVGWDVAITENGFDFVEMNCPGGHDIMQAFGTPCYYLYKN